MAFNSDIDVDVNILNRISFDLRIKEDMPKKSISVKHELDAAIQEYSQEHKNDDIVEHRQEYDGDDVFFSQLDYLHEFYDATHKIFDFENFCYVVGYLSEQPMIEEKFPKDERYICFTKNELKKDFDKIIEKSYTPIEELLKVVYGKVYLANKHPTHDFIQPGFTYEELLETYQKVKFIQIYDKENPYKYSGKEIKIKNQKYKISAYDIVGKEISEMQVKYGKQKIDPIKPEDYAKRQN